MSDKSTKIQPPEIKKLWPGFDSIDSRVIAAVLILCVILIQGTRQQQTFDDAYITFRYARNISKGLGFVYNPGENVLGTTTPLYTLLLSLFALLSKPEYIPRISFLISIVADALNVWLLFRLSDWIFKNREIAVLTSVIFLLQPFRLNVAAGGMETSLFLTCLLLSYDRYLLGERSFSTSIWAAIAILIRPDAVIPLIPLFLDWLISDQRGFLKSILTTGLIITPWFLWSTLNFGSPIPHSIIAKNISYKNPPGLAAFYLLTFIGTGTPGPYLSPYFLIPGLILGLPLMLTGVWILIKNRSKGLVVGLYPILYTIMMAIINPPMYFSWYFIPLIPGLLILIMVSIWYGLKQSRRTKLMIASMVSVILLVYPTYLLIKQPNWPLSRSREGAFWNVCNTIKDLDLKNKTVLTPDIGVIGWCLEEAKILDPIGLVSPEATSYNKELPPDQLVSPDLISDKQPDYIISLDQFINPNILENEDFQRSYELIYEMNVKIVKTNQPLYVFQRKESLP